MKKNTILISLGVLLTLLFVGNAARFYNFSLVERLSSALYDQRLRFTMPATVDERIVILDINEKSLKEEGRWPWGRDRLAVLMDQLFDHYGVAVVGFDVVFAEPDNSSGLKILEQLSSGQLKDDAHYQEAFSHLKPQLQYDKLFADKIKNRAVVLGYYFTAQKELNTSGELPRAAFGRDALPANASGIGGWSGYGANLSELQSAARGAGHFNPIVDSDGVVRRVPMLIEYEGSYYASLSLAMVQVLLGDANLKLGFAETQNRNYANLEWLELVSGDLSLKIPVDSGFATLVPYRGKQGSFRYLSVSDVLHGRVALEELKNKIVLVGTTAPGLMDMRSTPVSEAYAGVEGHANMIAGILDQNIKQQPAYMVGAEVLWLLIIGVTLSFLLPWLAPMRAILTSIAAFLVSYGLSWMIWQNADLVLPMANSLLLIVALFALNMSFGYFVESRTKRQITEFIWAICTQ